MTVRRILIIILSTVITSLVGYAGKAMWENYQHNGSVFKFERPPQPNIVQTEKPNIQPVNSSTEIFIAQSSGFDHLEPFTCVGYDRAAFTAMVAKMNEWMKVHPEFQATGFVPVADARNYIKVLLVCKKNSGMVNLERAKKKKD